MKSLLLALLIVLAAGAPACAQTAADERAVGRLPIDFTAAWNSHNGRQLAMLMSEDVDFVNVNATVLQGRPAFEAQHIQLLTGRFSDSKLTPLETSVRFLRPDVAIVRWNWSMAGDRDPDGTPRPPRTGAMMMVVEKKNGGWLVTAAQNTNRSMPTPTGQPG